MTTKLTPFSFKIDDETREILALLADHEERSMSDCIRRAVRLHAEQLNLVKPKRKPKPKAVRDA